MQTGGLVRPRLWTCACRLDDLGTAVPRGRPCRGPAAGPVFPCHFARQRPTSTGTEPGGAMPPVRPAVSQAKAPAVPRAAAEPGNQRKGEGTERPTAAAARRTAAKTAVSAAGRAAQSTRRQGGGQGASPRGRTGDNEKCRSGVNRRRAGPSSIRLRRPDDPRHPHPGHAPFPATLRTPPTDRTPTPRPETGTHPHPLKGTE